MKKNIYLTFVLTQSSITKNKFPDGEAALKSIGINVKYMSRDFDK